jgi:glycosyltransferase involved in cell wall biosynthesis
MADQALREVYARCRAFVFPGEEEFGIAPLEAMATGRPVIAYAAGALAETVVDGVSGLFFREQTPDALIDVLRRFEVSGFSPEKVRQQACRFDEGAFRASMAAFVAEATAPRGRPSGMAGMAGVPGVVGSAEVPRAC